MPIGKIANRIEDAVAGLSNTPQRGEVRLVSFRAIGDSRDLTIPIAEARKVFDASVEFANKTLGKADALDEESVSYSQHVVNLRETLDQLKLGVLSAQASPQSIRTAAAALAELNTAIAFSEDTDVRKQLSSNEFAEAIAFHTVQLDSQARALRKEPGLEAAAEALKNAAESLRDEVRLNYLKEPIAPYSIQEIGNFKALHLEAGIKILDDILGDLKTRIAAESADQNIQNQSAPRNLTLLKLQDQLRDVEAYKTSLEQQVSDAKSEGFQSNNPSLVTNRRIKTIIGGRAKTGLKAALKAFPKSAKYGIETKIAKSLVTKSGRNGKNFVPNSKLHLKVALAAHMEGFLKGKGISGYQFKDLAGQIESGYRDGVERQPWIRIKRDIPLDAGNSQTVHYENTLVPAREISADLAQSYRGLEGVSSLSNAEPNHPVNLWKTTFRPAVGQFSFSGIRHGVHDAFKIKDKAQRVAAADRKVAEFIKASVQSAPPQSLTKNPDGSYNITIVSASVLTPSSLNGEDAMLQHQLDAYKRANENTSGFQIQIKNANGESETVTVHPKIIPFNTGVNSWALSRSPIKAFTSIFSWRASNQTNSHGFEQLIGDIRSGQPIGGAAGEAIQRLNSQIADLSTSPVDKRFAQRKLATINQLVSQIREITNASDQSSTSYKQIGKEPYKLPVRLLALANEIGATPAFNCKSGKDRTGQLDVEVKDFYTYLNAHNGEVRPINHVRDHVELENFKKLFELGGGREIQKFNTGVPGSKVELSIFYDLLGYEKNTVDDLRGLSKWIGS